MVTSFSTGYPEAVAIHAMRSATTAGSSESRSSGAWALPESRCVGSNVPQLVLIAPGYSTQTRIPSSRPSAASDWVRPVKANLVEQYADALAHPRRPATEEIFTTNPPPRSRMCGIAARVSMKGAVRFTARTRSHCSSERLSADPGTSVPAALTSTDNLPSSRTARSTISPSLAANARSTRTGRARTPFGFNLVRYIVKITLSATKQRYVRPGGRQTQSDGPAEPAGRTGDDDGRARQYFPC